MLANVGLKGIIPPLVTPLTPKGAVDRNSLKHLINFLIEGGVSGLFVLGSTGEGPFLRISEKVKVVGTAVETADGRVPVLAGILTPGPAQAVEEAKRFQKIGVDYLVVAPPYYYPCSQEEVVSHFKIIKSSVGLRIFAYNIPTRVPVQLGPKTLLSLYRDKVIVGVKDSSGNFTNFRELLLLRNQESFQRFTVLTGTEQWVDMAILAGADGAIPGFANVIPHEYSQIYQCAVAGDIKRAVMAQEKVMKLFDIINLPGGSFTRAALGAFKVALWLKGVIKHYNLVSPFPVLSKEEVQAIHDKLLALNFLVK